LRFFVTGGAGFIGSHLVDRLIAEGNHVTVFDNFSSGRREFVAQHKGNKRFALTEGDLLEFQYVRRGIAACDAVVHLAANPDARLGITDTALDLRLETMATYNVLEAMRVEGIKYLVFASSGTIYGETPVEPIPENYGPLLPVSLYGAGKLASEGLISAFCNIFGLQAWIFRFANIVGGRATHGVILDFINKLKNNPDELEILGDGTQRKPYLHVQDCIDGLLYGFRNSRETVNVFNLGCPTTTDVNTIAKLVVKEMGLNGVKFNFTGGDRGWPGDVPQVRFSVSKMTKLGWKASHTSDEAVRQATKDILASLNEYSPFCELTNSGAAK
jgi:UDP-glucose 4-epimerase